MKGLVTLVEQRKVNLCNCKVSAGVKAGILYRHGEELFYSEKERPSLDDMHTAFEEGFLVKLTDDKALELELGHAEWEALYTQPSTWAIDAKANVLTGKKLRSRLIEHKG